MNDPTTTTLARTPFHDQHVALGGKMIPFAGFEMPIQYPEGILAEHRTVRTAVGVFDVSHMGEVIISGPNALALVQRLSTNDAERLLPNHAQYATMCMPSGGIIDDLLVYRYADRFMLVVNASNRDKDVAWMQSVAAELGNVTVTDVSDQTALLAVQGPLAVQALQPIVTDCDLTELAYYRFDEGTLAGVPATISRTGYTGELGFELYFDAAHGPAVWSALMAAGAPVGLKPIGLGARDTLRLEKGYCLYGNDIDQTTDPLEAGLGWVTKLGKSTPCIGHDALVEKKAAGPSRKLVGFTLDDRACPRHGYPLVDADGAAIGTVTSGTVSPGLNRGIGMGYVQTAHAAVGSAIFVSVRGKSIPATVVKLPFL